MTRRHTRVPGSRGAWLAAFCAAVCVSAVGLRLRSHRAEASLVAAAPTPARAVGPLPEPHDYVLNPMVDSREAGSGPRRIVSLAPSATESLCALGLRDRLVGRTQFCTYPPDVSSVPALGGELDSNLEMIRAAEPDVVFTTSNSSHVNAKLDRMGIRRVSLPHEGLQDVFTAIELAGQACDRPATARRLCQAIRADLAWLQTQAAAARLRPLRILTITDPLPVPPSAVWVAGPGSFLGELITLSGHQNAAGEALQHSSGQIPLERLLLVDPDVILALPLQPPSQAELAQAYRSWSKVGALRAIYAQRVRTLHPDWLRAGPRIARALHELITVLSEFK